MSETHAGQHITHVGSVTQEEGMVFLPKSNSYNIAFTFLVLHSKRITYSLKLILLKQFVKILCNLILSHNNIATSFLKSGKLLPVEYLDDWYVFLICKNKPSLGGKRKRLTIQKLVAANKSLTVIPNQ